jgi:type II secretory pathway pseudopilin PulG
MIFATATNDDVRRAPRRRRGRSTGFTLVEVLASLLFLAIVIPAAVEAMRVASLSGQVAAKKGAAARVADSVLNESIVLTNWAGGTRSGTVSDGAMDYHWKLTSKAWQQNSITLLTAEVAFQAQGRDFSVKLSTLALPEQPSSIYLNP